MTETKWVLERIAEEFEPSDGGLEATARMLSRRQRRRRLGAGALAMMVAAAGVGLGVFAFERSTTGVISLERLRPNGPIAFSAIQRNGPPRQFESLYVLPPNAKRPVRVLPPKGYAEPAWSPDGTKLALTTGAESRLGGIAVMNPDGSDLRTLVQSRESIGEPAWSPDGRWIAFVVQGRRLDVVSAEGGPPRTVTTLRTGLVGQPAWSPDGRTIVFGWDELFLGPGTNCATNYPHGLYEVNVNGGSPRQISDGCDRFPAWSPDGSLLAFVREPFLRYPAGIFVMPAQGRPRRVLNGCLEPAATHLCLETGISDLGWSPDGTHLVFVQVDRANTLAATGGTARPLSIPSSLVVTAVSWGPSLTGTAPTPKPVAPSPSAGTTASVQVSVLYANLLSPDIGTAVLLRCTTTSTEKTCISRLYATHDFGRSWTDITPAGVGPDVTLEEPVFLDPGRGWVISYNCALGQERLLRTIDGGRTWHEGPAPAQSCNAGAAVVPDFVDPSHGWLLHLEPTGPAAELERTSDGGVTWSKPERLPTLGGIEFLDPSFGWLGGADSGFGSGQLFRTVDAGLTWQRIRPPVPPELGTGSIACSLPSFFGLLRGVVPCTVVQSGRDTVVFDATSDGGHTWHLAGSLLLGTVAPRSGFPSVVVAPTSIPSASTWWVVGGEKPATHVTTDGGRTWNVSDNAPARPETIQAVDGRVGWLDTFTLATGGWLYRTTDGGASWVPLHPGM